MAKKKAKKSGDGGMTFVVASKCKEFLKGKDRNVASDALDGLNKVVGWYLEQAAARSNENGRKTVRAHDFMIG